MLVPIPKIVNIDEFNESLFSKCDKEMERNHYRIDKPIIELLEENKMALSPLPFKRFVVGRTIKVKTDGNSYFRYENNRYSTKPGLAHMELLIQITAVTICVLDFDYNEIDVHDRHYKQMGEPIVHWKHYLGLISRKPKAINYSPFYNSLPSIWKMALESLDDRECAEVLKKVAHLFFDICFINSLRSAI